VANDEDTRGPPVGREDRAGKGHLRSGAHIGRLPANVETQFRTVASSSGDVEHWIGLLDARSAARTLLTGLESVADQDDWVQLGAQRVKFQTARLLGVQAYLASGWALADCLTAMVGRVICTPDTGMDPSKPAKLVSHFVERERERKRGTASAVYEAVRHTFGWPIAVSYALRNHFLHDGGRRSGASFFRGPTAASGFSIDQKAWRDLEDAARGYGVQSDQTRPGLAWPTSPQDDLRVLLDVCERETDDALGILVSSACRSMVAHWGCMVGED